MDVRFMACVPACPSVLSQCRADSWLQVDNKISQSGIGERWIQPRIARLGESSHRQPDDGSVNGGCGGVSDHARVLLSLLQPCWTFAVP